MFLVFKGQILLSLLMCLAFSFPSVASAIESEEVSDPLAQFHEEELQSKVVDEFVLENEEPALFFKIYVINQREPFNEPLSLNVYVQCEEGRFFRVKRSQKNNDEKTYCQYGEPRIEADEALFGDKRSRLILPVAPFSEAIGGCDVKNPIYEILPVNSLANLCGY